MNSPRIKCGVAGVGYLGQHHARIYRTLPGAELAGIYETDTARAEEMCRVHQCRRFDTIEELGRACDAVSVVVPTDRHCAIALPLLAAGCHVLIEKPLCVSLEEAAKIEAAAGTHGRLVQVGHIEHFNPVMTCLEPEVCDPRYIVAERLAPFQPRGTEVGVVLDLMIHDIGLALALARSPVERIDAVGACVVSKTEDHANARIVFANGCVANLTVSRVSPVRCRELRVFQADGHWVCDLANQSGRRVRRSALEEHVARLAAGALLPGSPAAMPVEEIPVVKGEPLAFELASFVDCVTRGATPRVGIPLARAALEVALAVTEQIRTANRAARL